jgi:hypothetical protein
MMPEITLGHQLARELSRRGNRRRFFWTAQYRELRQIDSVEELAEFLDRTGYRCARASDDVQLVADDIETQCRAPGLISPAKAGLIDAALGLLLLPIVLVWRMIWRE